MTTTAKGQTYVYWRSYYVDNHGKRRPVLLGRADGPKGAALTRLQARKAAAALSAKMLAQPAHLASMGRGVALGQWVEKFTEIYAGRTRKGTGKPISPASIAQAKEAGRLLVEKFGEGAKLRTIDREAAGDFRRWLGRPHTTPTTKRKRTRAEATIRTMLRYASIIFEAAADVDIVPFNPFDREDLSSVARKKPYVPAEDVEKVIGQLGQVVPEKSLEGGAAATSPRELAALLACVRYGGLRCKDDTHRLTWKSVDWARCELRVEGRKTDQPRVVPMRPELVRHLTAWFESAPTTKTRLRGRRGTGHKTGKVFLVSYAYASELIKDARERSGVKPWPALFHSLRASARTDITRMVGEGEAASILGHSVSVARKHYGQEALRASESAHDRVVGNGQ